MNDLAGVRYIFIYVLGGTAFWGLIQGGAWTWLGVGLVFVLHPFLDLVFKKQQVQELNEPSKKLAEKIFFLCFPYCYLLMCFFFVQMREYATEPVESWIEVSGFIVSTGIMMGVIGINTAHELIHREGRLEQSLGVLQLMMVNFGHFRINHVDIHHRLVATPADSSTAKEGEILYFYWVRSFVNGWRESWRFEKSRLRTLGLNKLQSLLQNRMLEYLATSTLASIGLWIWGGLYLTLSWWAVSFVAIALLQTVDYLEHYGLLRKELKPGVYEAVKAQHSWDSYSLFTNLALFNLGIHSHHHLRSQLAFTNLKASEGIAGQAKKLPFGYSVMLICALVPPLWFRLMKNDQPEP